MPSASSPRSEMAIKASASGMPVGGAVRHSSPLLFDSLSIAGGVDTIEHASLVDDEGIRLRAITEILDRVRPPPDDVPLAQIATTGDPWDGE